MVGHLTNLLFATVPQRDYLQFWQSGRFQPQRVVRFLGLTKEELAGLADIASSSVRFDAKAPRALLDRIMNLASICELVAEAFNGNQTKTRLWFMTGNPQLEGASPVDLLRHGRDEVLKGLIIDAMNDNSEAKTTARSLGATGPLDLHRNEILQLCRRFSVQRLDVFGSAMRPDFDPLRSDIDLAVQFGPSTTLSPASQYLDFKAELERLLQYPVDLVELSGMPDSRLRRIIDRTRMPVYAEAT